jgi:hypothetical protein
MPAPEQPHPRPEAQACDAFKTLPLPLPGPHRDSGLGLFLVPVLCVPVAGGLLMSRCVCLLLVILGCPAAALAQGRVAPLYSLPADGRYVDYTWELVTADGKKHAGTLRISSVGAREEKGVRHRWVEIKLTFLADDAKACRLRKVLVSEPALGQGKPLTEAVVRGFRQHGPDGPVLPLSPGQRADVLGMGFTLPNAALTEVQADATVLTGLGKKKTRYVRAAAKEAGRTLEYHGWLTADVPFGWARFEIREPTDGAAKTTFRAVAQATGSGARSELDETRAGKEERPGRRD